MEILGYVGKKLKIYQAPLDMITMLLDLNETCNDEDTIAEFVPFKMRIVTEGVNIVSMEIPQDQNVQEIPEYQQSIHVSQITPPTTPIKNPPTTTFTPSTPIKNPPTPIPMKTPLKTSAAMAQPKRK